MMHDPTYKLSEANRSSPLPVDCVSLLFSWGNTVNALALREGQTLIVGRAEPATLIIDDRSLSRTHARLTLQDGAVGLEDLDSTNGSSVNGVRVHRAVLNDGDVAQLGTIELRIAARGSRVGGRGDLLSHAAFTHLLVHELERARVFGRAVSVVALRNGEGLGAAAILLVARSVDRVCRVAPELWLVLLPETDGRAASTWIEKLQRGSRSWAAGVASYPALICDAEEMVSRALHALHAAKPGSTADAVAVLPHTTDEPVVLSAAMRRLYDLVARAARTTLPVLVLGETGSGKELVARAVHERSARANAPFKALNCATIPVSLVESMLFGHERGAFTGAERQTPGIFEQAQGGTVFLDEVGELAPQAQAALLRVLEQRRLVRVGGTRELAVDARVVAATHRDLPSMVAAGTFREDLMFRLDALSLRVPPLRERRDEIAPLAELFLQQARRQWGATAQRFSEEALEALSLYAWPGNVRQLKNAVERAVAVCLEPTIRLEDLPEHVWFDASDSTPASVVPCREEGAFVSLPDRVRTFEIELIRSAMERAHGNQAQAARMLGVPRRTLANKVHAYGLLDVTE